MGALQNVAGRGSADHGFSLVEVLVAVTVLLIVLGGTLNAMVGSMASVRGSRDRQQAVTIANEVIERARLLNVADLAMRSGDPAVPGASFDHDGSGPQSPEATVVTPTGQVTGPTYHRTADGFFVFTVVTWFDDPLRTATTMDTRRVTAMVLWTPAGGPLEMVRLSTLVSSLPRGVG